MDDYRYELKYIVTSFSRLQIVNFIKMHPALFREIYPERAINNIYFDNRKFKNFSDNVIGISDRIKTRIRWYGNTFGLIKRPVLECKIKSSSVGRKEYATLDPFILSSSTTNSEIMSALVGSSLDNLFQKRVLELNPVLLNNYTRRYFISSCNRFRITYDYDLSFYDTKLYRKHPFNYSVLEIKFNKEHLGGVSKITSNFPFRLNKSSKYVIGVHELTSLPSIY